ncbi:MAG: PAS domain S-box protein [Rhizobiales bacterium]|nr:PAS domain S-box protein [Hyphomicrobiales bacterium]
MVTETAGVRPDASARGKVWHGWRPFFVDHRVDESDTITSFWLRPVDREALPPHEPGQHITLRATGEGAPAGHRNYSLSAPGDGRMLRISVKRDPKGAVSRWLHDHAVPGTAIDLLPPSGDFYLPPDAGRPLVLVSAGVGITPLMAMLEAADPARRVAFLHGTRDGSTHAFGARVRQIAGERPGVTSLIRYSRPRGADAAERDFDAAGHLTVEDVARAAPLAESDIFVCGPVSFMRDVVTGLRKAGVPAARIHTEFFGDFAVLDETLPGAALALAPGNAAAAPPQGLDPATLGAALLDSAADAIMASDRAGTIVLWNPGAERIFGFSADEALGQSLDIIIPEPLRVRHWEGYHHTVATGVSRYGAGDLLAVPGLHRDGHRLSLEFTIVLVKDAAGAVTGMVSTLRDVTRRFEETRALKKRIAELEAAS